VGIPCPDNTILHQAKAFVLSNQVILEAHNKGIPDNQATRDSSNHRNSHVKSEVRSSKRVHKEALQCSQGGILLILIISNKVQRVVRLKSSTAAREDTHLKLRVTHLKRVDTHRKLVLVATLLNKDNIRPDRKGNNGVHRVNKGRLSNALLPKTRSKNPGHTQDWILIRRHESWPFRVGHVPLL
jgi:hypothetical protein